MSLVADGSMEQMLRGFFGRQQFHRTLGRGRFGVDLNQDPFTTYIEVVTAQRVAFHRKYLTECLDTLLLESRRYRLGAGTA